MYRLIVYLTVGATGSTDMGRNRAIKLGKSRYVSQMRPCLAIKGGYAFSNMSPQFEISQITDHKGGPYDIRILTKT